MKKFLLFLSFCLVFAACVTTIPNNTNSNTVYAQDSKYIYVVGRAEIEKQADSVEISFCMKNTAKSYTETQTKLNESLQNLETQIKEIDNQSELVITSCSIKPAFAKNNSYASVCNFVIKTKCFDCIDKITEIAGNNGVYCFNGINYILDNKQTVLNEVYELAKQDANKKAKNISEKAELIDSIQFKQMNLPFFNSSEKIKISAVVKNMYELFNDDYLEIEQELDDKNAQNENEQHPTDQTNTQNNATLENLDNSNLNNNKQTTNNEIHSQALEKPSIEPNKIKDVK